MITFILGTRPEAIKMAPLVAKIPADQRRLIYTGQHYDEPLARSVWEDVGGYEFDEVLRVDGENDAERCGYLTRHLAAPLAASKPRWVVVQGDTTSALAGALAARKLGIDVYHVESGCRSGDPLQPEEWNRKAIDHLATGHAYSYPQDGLNLRREGILNALWSGDIAIDSLTGDGSAPMKAMPYVPGRVVVTIHRSETLADPEAMKEIPAFLRQLVVDGRDVIFFQHPHTAKVMTDESLQGVDVRPPATPHEFREILMRAEHVVTDSGGTVAEAAYLGIPCLIARKYTEAKDLLRWGKVALGGTDKAGLAVAFAHLKRSQHMPADLRHVWSGNASKTIAKALMGGGHVSFAV